VTSDIALEPAARAFADGVAGAPHPFDLGPLEGRRVVDALQSAVSARPEIDAQDVTIHGGPSGRVSLRILRPRSATAPFAVIMYMHGGGWVFGNAHTHDRLLRELVERTGAAVVFTNYSPAPEARYPVAIEEAYAALEWVARDGPREELDGTRIAVAGDGAGGNLAAALTMLAKQRSGPALAAQALLYPVTDAAFDTPSYLAFAERHHLRRDTMRWYWDQYAPHAAAREQITASPMRATPAELAGLPAALVITAEADVLRDEGEAYARKLRSAGVDVAATRYLGVVHDFLVLDALRTTHAAHAALAQTGAYLRKALMET
jgi:acetyl esterase